MEELIQKIVAQTGLPEQAVMQVVGGVLSHLSDILPAPIAHQVAVMLGIHQEGDGQAQQMPQPQMPQQQASTDQGLGGLLSGLAGALTHGGGGAAPQAGGGGLGGLLNQFGGASVLASVAEQLLAGMMTGRR